MNSTNRAVNRIVLLVAGIMMIAVGAVVAALQWPPVADIWRTAGAQAEAWRLDSMAATPIQGTTVTWFAVGFIGALVIIVIVLALLLTSIGGRRRRGVVRSSGEENSLGRVTVREAFVSDVLREALRRRDDIVTAGTSAADVRGRPVLHVAVTPRQNTSPRMIVDEVETLVSNLETMTGRALPTYISVHSGLRAKLASDKPRVS